MKTTTAILLTCVSLLLCCGLAFAAGGPTDKRTPAPDLSQLSDAEYEAFYLGANAIIWGYPAVLFEDLMRGRTQPDIVKKGNPQTQVNQFGSVRELRGPEYKQIATPNNDTLYTQSFCDVSKEPLVLSVPKVDAERYYCIQFWDPNGDTKHYVGSRETGREAGNYVIVGPDWEGKLPKDLKRIDLEYNCIVLWGRVGVRGAADLENAHAIQDGLYVTLLSKYDGVAKLVPVDMEFSKQRVAYNPPADLPKELELYYKLAQSLKHTPAKQQDAVVFKSLEQIGFTDKGLTFDYKSLSPAQQKGLAMGSQYAQHLIDVNAQTTGQIINGWRWSPKSGVMGDDYLFRAAFAKWFTGGHAPEEAVYMDGRNDDKGEALDGSKHSYTMHFKAGELPPVSAFWSLSMYHLSDGSFVENSIERYSIGERTDGLTKNADGSLDLYLQAKAPTDPKEKANWLPCPEGGFYLNMRFYVPDEKLQKGEWTPPYVEQVK